MPQPFGRRKRIEINKGRYLPLFRPGEKVLARIGRLWHSG
jgi:hypothetical protein